MPCCGYWDCHILQSSFWNPLVWDSKQHNLCRFNAVGVAAGEDTVTLHGLRLQVARGELLGICGEVRSSTLSFVVHRQLRV